MGRPAILGVERTSGRANPGGPRLHCRLHVFCVLGVPEPRVGSHAPDHLNPTGWTRADPILAARVKADRNDFFFKFRFFVPEVRNSLFVPESAV